MTVCMAGFLRVSSFGDAAPAPLSGPTH